MRRYYVGKLTLDELMTSEALQCDGVDGACRDRLVLVEEIRRLRRLLAFWGPPSGDVLTPAERVEFAKTMILRWIAWRQGR
jgi:hypothetical protein